MPSELQDLMSDLEMSLVETVARLEQVERDLLFVGVVEIEQRIEGLHDALASVADSIAQRKLLDLATSRRPRPGAVQRRAISRLHVVSGRDFQSSPNVSL